MGYKVTAVTGTNEGSLYDAIQKVNEGIYSSIEFDSSLDGQTIQFPAGVSIEKPVTISGNVILAGPAILSSADVTLEPAGFALSVQEQEEKAVYGIQVLKESDSDVISSNLKLSSFNGSIVISGGSSEGDYENDIKGSNAALKAATIISDGSAKGSSSIQMDGFHGSIKMDRGVAIYSGEASYDSSQSTSTISLGDYSGNIEIGITPYYENGEERGGGAVGGILAHGEENASIQLGDFTGTISLIGTSDDYETIVSAIFSRTSIWENELSASSTVSIEAFEGNIRISGGSASNSGIESSIGGEYYDSVVKNNSSSVSIKAFAGTMAIEKGSGIIY